ncbi:MAG TPA: HlyD family efflux transporter periplasmic adaptor subunit [Polyangiaceae bacterium]|jgi:HlyD family secretion protein
MAVSNSIVSADQELVQPPAFRLTSADDVARRQKRERKRKLTRGLRQGLLGLIVLAAAGAAVLSLRPRPVPVDLASVTRGPLLVAIQESGMTRVKDRYEVSAPVNGRLSRLALEVGDRVHEGDALAEIAPALSPLLDDRTRAEAEARLGAALSALDQARAQTARATTANQLAAQELTRSEQLAASGSLAAQALEQAQFAARMRADELNSARFSEKVAGEEVRVARVTLGHDSARAAIDHHVDVLSPIAGRVLRVHQKSEGVVQAGTSLVEVGDPGALEVVVDLLTTDAVHVGPGTEAVIEGWGGDSPLAGRVRRLEPSAFTRASALGVDEQRVNVIIALTDAPEKWAALGDAYRVEARFVLWQAPSVLKAPQGAVFRYRDSWAVFRIENGTAHLVPVRIGHRGESEVEITSGLSAGAELAVHPGDRVKDGARVEPR